jgi:stage II sporulation protein D
MLLLVLVGSCPLVADTVPERVYQSIREGDYQPAGRKLRQLTMTPETVFLRGYVAFKRNEFTTARDYFKKVVDRSDTDHVRHRDALYYLDRLKLYGVESASPPRIRVRIGKGVNRVSFDSDVTVEFIVDGESKGRAVAARTTIEKSFDRLEINSLRQTDLASRVEIRPVNADGLQYKGVLYRGSIVVETTKNGMDVINELPLDHYLDGVVRKELAPGWPMAVIRAQAVASRSFALQRMIQRHGSPYHVSSTDQSQVYGGRKAETPRIKQAVESTSGEVLTYQGRVIPAYFHANSGGFIEAPHKVWGGEPTSFIRPRRDRWSLRANHQQWSHEMSVTAIRKALTEAGHPAPSNGEPSIEVAVELPSGRAQRVRYRGTRGSVTISANDFRVALGAGRIKSTWFTAIRRSGSTVEFSGRGWGHGVGMSQWGARKMAEAGKSYREILQFYYAPTTIAARFGPAQVVSSSP